MKIIAKVPLNKLCLNQDLISKLTQHIQAKSRHSSSSLQKHTTSRVSKRKLQLVTSAKTMIAMGTQTLILLGFTKLNKLSQRLHMKLSRLTFSTLMPNKSSSSISKLSLILTRLPNPNRLPALTLILEYKNRNDKTTYLRCKNNQFKICSTSKRDQSLQQNKS